MLQTLSFEVEPWGPKTRSSPSRWRSWRTSKRTADASSCRRSFRGPTVIDWKGRAS